MSLDNSYRFVYTILDVECVQFFHNGINWLFICEELLAALDLSFVGWYIPFNNAVE